MTSTQLSHVVSSVNSNPALSSLTSDRLFLTALSDAGIQEHELGDAHMDDSVNDWYWMPTRHIAIRQYGHTGRFAVFNKEG
jgi:hypothetical protein